MRPESRGRGFRRLCAVTPFTVVPISGLCGNLPPSTLRSRYEDFQKEPPTERFPEVPINDLEVQMSLKLSLIAAAIGFTASGAALAMDVESDVTAQVGGGSAY